MQFIKTFGVAAALASMAVAQPHGHRHQHAHEKRDLVWVTEWVTVDPATQTVEPTSTSTSTPPPPPPTTTSTTSTSSSTSSSTTSSSTTSVALDEKLAVPTPSSSTIAPSVPTTTAVASSTSSAATASGTGLVVANQLDKPIYAWVTNNVPGEMQTIPAGGSLPLHEWLVNPNGGGVSVKFSTTTSNADSVLQFEYTYEHPTLWWDMSSINMLLDSLFVTHGFLVTNDAGCKTVTCEGGNANCKESYQHPNDIDTLSCTAQSLFTLTLAPTVEQIAKAALEVGENML